MTTILLADDHNLVREGIKNVFLAEKDFSVIGEASDGWQALKLIRELTPDIVLMDLLMPGLRGDEVISLVKTGASRCILLTSSQDEQELLAAANCGAVCLLLKTIDSATLVKAVRTIADGGVFFDEAASVLVARGLMQKNEVDRVFSALSAREKDVLLLIARGLSNKEIGFELGISENTVKVHIGNILEKTDCADRLQAALFVWKSGLLDVNKKQGT